MKILYITSGAAGMYCGSCIRDNALAAELLAQGHDVILTPTYTPTLTDEPNVSGQKVFFGGISVYLEQAIPLFRKTPRILDSLWDSRLALNLASRAAVQVNPKKLGKLTVSVLKGADGFQSKEVRKLVEWLATEPRPDIVNITNSLLIGLARPIKEVTGSPVCCMLQGEDIFLDGLSEPYRSMATELIRSNVPYVDAFAAVSDYYAAHMSKRLGIPESKMEVVPLGINLDGYSPRASARTEPFTIGFFARIAPEKGLHVLCEAYYHLRQRSGLPESRLVAAGYLGREHRPYLRQIERRMKEWGLADEFQYSGVLDRDQKIEFLKKMDLLSVPATYDEPKGMFLLEAMACGVPVVQPSRGTFTEVLKKTGGGILVEPDNIERLADGILQLWQNPALADQLARKGAESVAELYSVRSMASRALAVYEKLLINTPATVLEAVS